MFDANGAFVPSFIPKKDLEALQKFWGAPAPERFGMGNSVALVVVDMTRGFVEDRFITGWEETGVPCAQAIRQLLELTRRLSVPTFFTRPIPHTAVVERGRWSRRTEPNRALRPQPAEALEFYPLIQPRLDLGEVVIQKQKPSAFHGSALHAMLTYLQADTLIVTGMTTSGCVRGTVNDAFSNNFRTIVPYECVADRSQVSHEIELFNMGAKYADIVPLSVVMDDLERYAATRERELVAAR